MYFRFEYAPKDPKAANTNMTTPIIIIIMDRVVTSLTAWMQSKRDLMWSVSISDTFFKVRLPTMINPNPMNCQIEHVWLTYWEKAIYMAIHRHQYEIIDFALTQTSFLWNKFTTMVWQHGQLFYVRFWVCKLIGRLCDFILCKLFAYIRFQTFHRCCSVLTQNIMLMVKNTFISIKSQSRAMVTKSESTNKSNFESKVSIFHIV